MDRRSFNLAAVSAAAGLALPSRAPAVQKTLRILKWKHFVPSYDKWFGDVFVKQWSEANDTQVIVDLVGMGDLSRLVQAESDAGSGHDLIFAPNPPAVFEDQVIDHRDVVAECERRYGPFLEIGRRSSHNPVTGKYYCLVYGYGPTTITYRSDLWDAVGMVPDKWDAVRRGGRAIKLFENKPVGISLAAEHNAEHSWRAIMYAFGASVQDADGHLALKSAAMLEALKFGRALYQEAMFDGVLKWNPPANNRFMLAGEGSLTVDVTSIARAAESKSLPVDSNLALATLPEGPAGRIGPTFGTHSNIIWKFADNIDGATKFLVDLVGSSRGGFLVSGMQDMPTFPGAVPDLDKLTASDPVRPERYAILRDIPATITNLGYPGSYNAAIGEVYSKRIVSTMFASVATEQSSPERALNEATAQATAIFGKWREAGKI